MTTWVEQLHAKASIVHDQIMAAKEMQKLSGVDTSGVATTYWQLLEKLYAEDLPFAHLLDTSDILLHAEGPAASDVLPTLHAVNWLCQTAEKQLKLLAKATFDLSDVDANRLANKIDLRLTGLAPGSVYAGFRLQAPESSGLIDGEAEPIFILIKDTITRLPEIPGFIGDETINASIREAIPDSAIRDAMLNAAMHLAPTGKIGIHTVELSSPLTHRPRAELSQRERIVIREALKRPKLASPKTGSFVGQIREIDLDAKRFHLRGVKDCGTLRCIFPDHYKESDFKEILGDITKITGSYEEDKNGKPRLLLVEKIERIHQPKQERLD
jgi:hypothetical protein